MQDTLLQKQYIFFYICIVSSYARSVAEVSPKLLNVLLHNSNLDLVCIMEMREEAKQFFRKE